ncbi:MAG: rhodanese-like domain-containing protein [Sutterella sp.]
MTNLDQPILVYCKSGRRAALASDLLSFAGYTQVYNFLGVKQWPYDLVK